ncbi:MAG: NADH-quinone oxidoreductase subunit [Actinomycetota bacterium]|nr:NADH-quinone oxidoreductase subunit [Actinomycetota bacterium]
MSENKTDLVKVTVNGQEVEAENGRLLIDVAEEMGVFIPRFCYHPGMKSVAVCRMCLVQVEGQRKLVPACATPVADGMNANTVDEEAVDAQKDMLEFLLINHPLDCPICDRAGECPLQDQTYRHGPGSSRYIEEKRTYEKPIEISDLIALDRERCVLCWRCVRFSDEIAGDQFIQLVDRGDGTQILNFNDEPFDSYFSGNTVQICPVGALTGTPYRFVARPWDLETAPSVCSYCSVGCPISNESRQETLVRCQALPNENVNDFWVCDKGRFGYHYVSQEDRLETPLVRGSNDEFETSAWGAATALIAERLKGKTNVGVIAGGHLCTEDAFAIARLAKKVIKTGDVDSRIQDEGTPYERAIEAGGVAGSTAHMKDVEKAKTILWFGPDPKETLPVLYLHLRAAVKEHGAKLVVVSPREMSLDHLASWVVRCHAGEEASVIDKISGRIDGDGLLVCCGPSSSGRTEAPGFAAAIALAGSLDASLLICPPHAGSQGMIDMGVYPMLDAGYQPAATPGRDTRAILEAAAAGELDGLLIFGADPITDFPDADLARRALASKTFTVVMELFPTETALHADVVLPSTAYAEREGTLTNLERRLQKLEALLPAPGSAIEPWKAAAAIARALGDDWGWRNFDDVWTSIRKEVPTHKDVDPKALAQKDPAPAPFYSTGFAPDDNGSHVDGVAGPGGVYPKGHRQGAPFQTGQNWPLSWELRAFEAQQRPGLIPGSNGSGTSNGSGGNGPADGGPPESADAAPTSSSPGAAAQRGTPADISASPPASSSPPADASSPDSVLSDAATERRGPQSPEFDLITGRLIYDEGAMVSRTTHLRNIQRKPFLGMNLEDAKDLGLSDGDQVEVSGAGNTVTLPVKVEDVARGAVFVPYAQLGLRANTLMSGRDSRVKVTKR